MTFLASLLDERDAYRLLLSVALANSHADQRVIARLREELREQRETWTRCAERLMNDD